VSPIDQPLGPVVYTFTPSTDFNGRILLRPPSDAPDQRAPFSVVVAPDPFAPFVTNTILLRAPDMQGRETVGGSFECASPSMFTLRVSTW
jgi:hypothetical protein